jgi:DNA-binding CsgD family transcriptional regulator
MQGNLLSVIDTLYEGVLDEDAWGRGLAGIAELVSASGLLLMSCNPTSCEVLRFEAPGLDPTGMRDYQEHWIRQDPRYIAGLARPPGEAQVDDMLVPREVMRRSAVYNEFLRPMDVPFCIASWVIRTPSHGVTMCIEGTRRHGPFSEDERGRIAALLPHLRRVLQIKDRLAKAGTRAENLLEAMDRLPFGVLLLSDDLTVVEASASARATLAANDSVHAQGGRLGFRRSTDAQAFARTLAANPADAAGSEGVVVVRRLTEPGDVTLLTMPLEAAPDEWTRPRARHLVLVFDSVRTPPPSQVLLQRTYGLTASEARLAASLATGLSLAEIAERRGLSVQTLRSQLKSVFGKTGISAQTQLVRLVLTGPAGVAVGAKDS